MIVNLIVLTLFSVTIPCCDANPEYYYIVHGHGIMFTAKSYVTGKYAYPSFQWPYANHEVHFFTHMGDPLHSGHFEMVFDSLVAGNIGKAKSYKFVETGYTQQGHLWSKYYLLPEQEAVVRLNGLIPVMGVGNDDDVDVASGIYKVTMTGGKVSKFELLYRLHDDSNKTPIRLSDIAEKLDKDKHPPGPIYWVACQEANAQRMPGTGELLVVAHEDADETGHIPSVKKRHKDCIKLCKEYQKHIEMAHDFIPNVEKQISKAKKKIAAGVNEAIKDENIKNKALKFSDRIAFVDNLWLQQTMNREQFESFINDDMERRLRDMLHPLGCGFAKERLAEVSERAEKLYGEAYNVYYEAVNIEKQFDTFVRTLKNKKNAALDDHSDYLDEYDEGYDNEYYDEYEDMRSMMKALRRIRSKSLFRAH